MADKKVINFLLDGVIVFGSMVIGAKIKEIQCQAIIRKLQVKIKDGIIEEQRQMIEKLMEHKEEES